MRVSGTLVAVNAAGITYPQYYGSPPQDSGSAAPSESVIYSPSRFRIGLNLHSGMSTTAQNVVMAQMMLDRRMTVARMDLYNTNPFPIADAMARIKANGCVIQGVTQAYQSEDLGTATTAQSLSLAEAQAYSRTNLLVNLYKPYVTDFELLNEINLRADSLAQVAFNAGTSSAVYAGNPFYTSMYRHLKGMAAAISDIRASSGLALRVLVGVAGRDFGFLSHMQTLGLTWDVTVWHQYPRQEEAYMTDSWWGSGGARAVLESFGKPWTINEWNAAEPYTATYVNASGTVAERGFSGLTDHTRELYQYSANASLSALGILCDSLVIYEVIDTDPLGPFGLHYNITTTASPKVSMYIATAFSGGNLTTAEEAEITSRGLMSAGEIAAMRHV
jgi:hypothetical protein